MPPSDPVGGGRAYRLTLEHGDRLIARIPDLEAFMNGSFSAWSHGDTVWVDAINEDGSTLGRLPVGQVVAAIPFTTAPPQQQETETRQLVARWLYDRYAGTHPARDKESSCWANESDDARSAWLADAELLLTKAAASLPTGGGASVDQLREALCQARTRLAQCQRDRVERDKVLATSQTGMQEIDRVLLDPSAASSTGGGGDEMVEAERCRECGALLEAGGCKHDFDEHYEKVRVLRWERTARTWHASYLSALARIRELEGERPAAPSSGAAQVLGRELLLGEIDTLEGMRDERVEGSAEYVEALNDVRRVVEHFATSPSTGDGERGLAVDALIDASGLTRADAFATLQQLGSMGWTLAAASPSTGSSERRRSEAARMLSEFERHPNSRPASLSLPLTLHEEEYAELVEALRLAEILKPPDFVAPSMNDALPPAPAPSSSTGEGGLTDYAEAWRARGRELNKLYDGIVAAVGESTRHDPLVDLDLLREAVQALRLIAEHARLDVAERGRRECERYVIIAENALRGLPMPLPTPPSSEETGGELRLRADTKARAVLSYSDPPQWVVQVDGAVVGTGWLDRDDAHDAADAIERCVEAWRLLSTGTTTPPVPGKAPSEETGT